MDTNDDTIYPVFLQDAMKSNRLLLSWVMCFNDVLDAAKLETSLSRLLEIGDWRKLGGRLRETKTGQWELQVPSKFNNQRPAIGFAHSVHSSNIQDHPQAKHFPQPTKKATIQPLGDELKDFVAPPGFPTSFKDFVNKDSPQLTLFVSSFADATLVSLIWPHCLMDGPANSSLLLNWSRVLTGREDLIDTVNGASTDVFARLDDNDDGDDTTTSNKKQYEYEPLYLEPNRMSMLQIIHFILRFLWRILTNPEPQWRMIYLPIDTFTKLKARTMAEAVAAAAAKRSGHPDSFVTDGDVATLWLAQTALTALGKRRPFTLIDIVNVRPRLPFIAQSAGIYLQNSGMLAFTFYNQQHIGPLSSVGAMALVHRAALAAQTTEQQTLSTLHNLRKSLHLGKTPGLFFGDPSSIVMISNNVAKNNPMEVTDFGPAVIRQGETLETRTNPPGTVISYYNQPVHKPLKPSGLLYNWGKDQNQGLWLMARFPETAWQALEEDLQRL